MPQHSDFYLFVRDFFWMVFPIGAGIIAMFAAWLHHRRAQQALEVLQSFAAQGKAVPPELLALIQPRRRERARGRRVPASRAGRRARAPSPSGRPTPGARPPTEAAARSSELTAGRSEARQQTADSRQPTADGKAVRAARRR